MWGKPEEHWVLTELIGISEMGKGIRVETMNDSGYCGGLCVSLFLVCV